MKLLIVGGSGYVGGYLTDLLNEKGYDVTVYDNLTYEKYYLKNVNFIYGDVRDHKFINSIINNFDVVIWLAALVGDGACSINPELTYEINTNSVDNLCKNYQGKIIFISTCSIYGFSNDVIDEDGKKNPLSVYASTKLEAEDLIKKRNSNFLIIRLGTVFGLSDQFSRIRLDLVVNILTLKAANKEALTVFGGDQFRPLIHVKDVGLFIYHGLNKNISGIYNLSYKNFKIIDIAKEIKKNFIDCEIKHTNQMFQDNRNYKVSNERVIKTNFNFSYDLNSGINELSKIFTEKRIKNTNDEIYNNHAFLKKYLR